MLDALGVADASRVVCCSPANPRALDADAVAAAAVELGVPIDRVDVVDDVAAAVAYARDVTPPDAQVVVAGTLYVVGAARHALVDHP